MKGKVWFLLPLLAALIVGASFAGCVGSSGSSHSTPTPTATATATPTPTPKGGGPTPVPPPTGTPRPTPTPHPSKALVGFVIGFKVINFTVLNASTGKVLARAPPQKIGAYAFLVKPYLILPNGTKILLTANSYIGILTNKSDPDACFYVVVWNKTVKWNGPNTPSNVPTWGNTTFFFSIVWNKTTYYEKILPLLEKGAKIELVMGIAMIANFVGNLLTNFTEAVKFFTGANPIPVVIVNWTPGQSIEKTVLYKFTCIRPGAPPQYRVTLNKIYFTYWVKPVYWPWGQYPRKIYPWQIPGNNVLS